MDKLILFITRQNYDIINKHTIWKVDLTDNNAFDLPLFEVQFLSYFFHTHRIFCF